MAKQDKKKRPRSSATNKRQFDEQDRTASRVSAYRKGLIVLVILIILTVLEYRTAALSSSPVAILIFALGIGGLILAYYMHFADLL